MIVLIDDILYKNVSNYSFRGVYSQAEGETLESVEINFNNATIIVREANKIKLYRQLIDDEPREETPESLSQLIDFLQTNKENSIGEIHYRNYVIR
jgi:PDZ domain-containing secreted protein